jgi:uracil-DNA glycosylase family 4
MRRCRVVEQAMNAWEKLSRRIVNCNACPRLREHCSNVAIEKRAAYREQDYWGKPVPNMGEAAARLLIVGLAPGAHGANRTGRLFTGDRSGDFLFRAMHEAGFANQATSVRVDDGLKLVDCAITGVAHCAPPGNKPLPGELVKCSDFLDETVAGMPNLRVMLALGRIAFDACLRLGARKGWTPVEKPRFAHGAVSRFAPPGAPMLVASFHPSQQNTFTGRLTPAMMRDVFETCRELVQSPARKRAEV